MAAVQIITVVLDGQVMGSTRYPVLQTVLARKTRRTKQPGLETRDLGALSCVRCQNNSSCILQQGLL